MKKRILITGGTGFFGKSLLMHLPELQSYHVVVLSRRDLGTSFWPWIGIQGDVRDFKFPKEDFDYIYHGAATSSKIIPDDEMQSVILEGTKHVLEFAKKTSAKLLFVSSGAVYGDKYFPIKEEDICIPETVYGKAKLEAEQMCLKSGISCSIARCFAFVGEHLPLNAHFAIGNFIRDCLHNKDIVIRGDGTPLRSYLYTKDLVDWLWAILTKGEDNKVYNVGSDRLVSIGDLAGIVRNIAETNNEIRVLLPPSKKVRCYAPDISKARRELGLKIKIPLEEAIAKTIQYYRGNNENS